MHELGQPHHPGGSRDIGEIRVADHVGEVFERDILVLGDRLIGFGGAAGIVADQLVGLGQRGEDRRA